MRRPGVVRAIAAAAFVSACAPPPQPPLPRAAAPTGSRVRACVPIFLTSEWEDDCAKEVMFDEATRLGYFIYDHGPWQFSDAEIEPGAVSLHLSSEAVDGVAARVRLDGKILFGEPHGPMKSHGNLPLPAEPPPTRAPRVADACRDNAWPPPPPKKKRRAGPQEPSP